MFRHTTSLPLLVTGLVLAGCASAPASSHAAAPDAVPAVSTSPAPVAALATDQACTRRAAADAVLQRVPFRADDLSAMTLPKSALGTAVSRYETNWLTYGFMDNVELPNLRPGPASWCSMNRTYGRIGGFARSFVGAQDVWTANHLFFSAGDAAAWLSHYVAGMKALVGHKGVTAVHVSSLAASLGSGAVRISVRSRSGPSTSVFFRHGQVVGEVYDGGPPGSRPVIDTVAVGKKLATRVGNRVVMVTKRAADPVDAVVQMSAGLPKRELGTRYAGLAWDWGFGGCWDVAEAASQTDSDAAAAAYRRQAAKYGQLTWCRAMYSPPTGQLLNGVERAFTGGALYTTATGASGSMAQVLADWRNRAGRTVDGTRYGALTRFSVGALGDQRLALQQKAGSVVLTRVLIRHGRYVAIAALHARAFAAMTTDVKRWAAALDKRVTALLTTRRVQP